MSHGGLEPTTLPPHTVTGRYNLAGPLLSSGAANAANMQPLPRKQHKPPTIHTLTQGISSSFLLLYIS